MASKGGKPLDMKQTPEFIRHNPPNNRADFCIPLDEMIDKFSKHKTSPTAKYLLDTCEKLKDFMSTRNSEHSNSSIILEQEAQDTKRELELARTQIARLEEKIDQMSKTMQDHLRNSVILQEAKDTLETSYSSRKSELQEATKEAANTIQSVFNEKCQLLDQLKEERITQARKDEIHRTTCLTQMKDTLDTLSKNFFKSESEHIDRILNGINACKDKQDSMINDALSKFETIDIKVNKAVEILQKETENLSSHVTTEGASSPSYAAITAANSQTTDAGEDRALNILIYPIDPNNAINIGNLRKAIQETSKINNITFRCNNLFNISKGVKVVVPTIKDQQAVQTLFEGTNLKESYRLFIPKPTSIKLMIKFTSTGDSEEFIQELTSKNPSFPSSAFKVLFNMKAKTDYHWIIELQDPYLTLINTKYVFIGLKKCNCEIFLSVNHCKRCGEYGHSKSRCQAKEPRCLICGTLSP
ncbi:hypothetical protein JTE90_006705 [Oedothorax gibbosus]|uniref:CCHC-type domain-containing protein n=1 Tax=Oedothorax gibbosus TaxID=931172 RepID=A0AAV6TH24_9ARAC|nr:hypothetical protein JTE90_006705 [Oedothorax gibbosus]